MNRAVSPTLEHSSLPPRGRRNGGVVVPNAPRWHQRFAAWGVYALIRSVAGTLRCRWHDRSEFSAGPPGPVIVCCWHNRLAVCMRGYFEYCRPRNPTAGMAALVSASKDGAFLASILECFHVQPVRGSSSRRGPQALLELTTWAERGYDLAITPDGPRGPRYVVQPGIMSLAQVTGLPILPGSFYLHSKIQIQRSWDKFQIPFPFSRCDVVIGKLIRVPREASDAEREALRLHLESVMRSMTRD
jgi:lysophospholipid acyltransferase (LPLAT)-like uncharacterized protein